LAVSILIWLGEKIEEIVRLETFIGNLVNDGYIQYINTLAIEAAGIDTEARDKGIRNDPGLKRLLTNPKDCY
jgi:hypothetical protein